MSWERTYRHPRAKWLSLGRNSRLRQWWARFVHEWRKWSEA